MRESATNAGDKDIWHTTAPMLRRSTIDRDSRLEDLEKRQQAFQQKVSNQLEEISSRLAAIPLPKKDNPFP